jgi:hypothetical protein
MKNPFILRYLTTNKMKRFFLLALAYSISWASFAQSDEEILTNTVNDFLEGGTNGEVDRFRGAFLKDAVQRAVGGSGVTGMTVESLASKIKPGQKMDRTTRILSISYANNAATAITETEYATNKIIDMLNLLKVGNDWKIVSRVYSRVGLDESLATLGETKETSKPTAVKPKAAAPKAKKVVADDGW